MLKTRVFVSRYNNDRSKKATTLGFIFIKPAGANGLIADTVTQKPTLLFSLSVYVNELKSEVL